MEPHYIKQWRLFAPTLFEVPTSMKLDLLSLGTILYTYPKSLCQNLAKSMLVAPIVLTNDLGYENNLVGLM